MDGIEVSGAQTLFNIGPVVITQTIISLLVVNSILMVLAILLGKNLSKRPGKLQVLTEKGVDMLTNLERTADQCSNIALLVLGKNDAEIMNNYPNLWIPAGILIVAAVLAFNFVGDGLRDAMDPKSKK